MCISIRICFRYIVRNFPFIHRLSSSCRVVVVSVSAVIVFVPIKVTLSPLSSSLHYSPPTVSLCVPTKRHNVCTCMSYYIIYRNFEL